MTDSNYIVDWFTVYESKRKLQAPFQSSFNSRKKIFNFDFCSTIFYAGYWNQGGKEKKYEKYTLFVKKSYLHGNQVLGRSPVKNALFVRVFFGFFLLPNYYLC